MGDKMGKTKRVLITGGGGLVGGRVAEHLLCSGFQVRLGTRDIKADVGRLLDVDLVAIEWSDEECLRAICQDVDVIVNAMGMNATDCAYNPAGALLVNGVYVASLLKAAIASGVKRFIHLSTAHVYASPLQGWISESTCPSNLHPYATSHRSGEDTVLWAGEQGHIEGIVLRLSNAFGRPLATRVRCWMLLVNDLCRQAVENKNLTLKGNGLQHRDFIPLSAVCGLIDRLCQVDFFRIDESRGRPSPLLNVGSGYSMSVIAMAELIQSRCKPVLGYDVGLKRQSCSNEQEGPALNYVSNHLPSLCDMESFMDEIDKLLLYCNEYFR
ncbi:SDR family oxidoreductase [Chromobacterium haemolyticum]|uniref:SDR family oxidoreductase n=1 Tax=Chromobacterium fluminis TaxID=3044269 RepID=A0ABX0L7G9_9NEIS|nr:NAD-dependent epimerase/dehydratase [Chromobacterium haemolyticum]NHR06916.1 SDR family oxidoreductase [Chromobacterium haemolyticum]